MSNKSSIKRNALISSLPKAHQEIALELTESCLENEYTLIQKDCSIITSINSFNLEFTVDIDSSRIIAYTIHEMLTRKEFNEKYIVYDVAPADSPKSPPGPLKTTYKSKSKIIIIAKYTTLKEWKEELELWGFPIHYIISKSGIKKLNNITEDIIVIKDGITKYLDIDNFFDPSYQIYGFIGENKSDKKFCNLISPFFKSKVNISDMNSYVHNFYDYNYKTNQNTIRKIKTPIEDRFILDVNIEVKYKISQNAEDGLPEKTLVK
jgi:hypothetical protein